MSATPCSAKGALQGPQVALCNDNTNITFISDPGALQSMRDGRPCQLHPDRPSRQSMVRIENKTLLRANKSIFNPDHSKYFWMVGLKVGRVCRLPSLKDNRGSQFPRAGSRTRQLGWCLGPPTLGGLNYDTLHKCILQILISQNYFHWNKILI